jgi:hypothetical protein
MASLDSLPGDQRAVLQLVLGRGRSYDEIGRILSINPSAVRERAQVAMDALGPETHITPEAQARVADYLLGQLPDHDVPQVRDLLAGSPGARAWARVVASEVAPLAGDRPMPEIPAEGSSASDRSDREPTAEPVAAPSATEPAPVSSAPDPAPEAETTGGGSKRSSRLGGALVILVAVLVVAAVLFFVLRGGNSDNHTAANSTTATSTPAASASASTPTTSSSSSSTTSSTTSAKVVAQINLSPPPTEKKSKAAGIAEVLNEGSTDGVAIVAQNVPPNSTKPPNAYAVWLYNSPKDAKILGFVNPGVGKTGRLSTAGALPTNASHYKQLIVTKETTASPKAPGTIILQGALSNLQ